MNWFNSNIMQNFLDKLFFLKFQDGDQLDEFLEGCRRIGYGWDSSGYYVPLDRDKVLDAAVYVEDGILRWQSINFLNLVQMRGREVIAFEEFLSIADEQSGANSNSIPVDVLETICS